MPLRLLLALCFGLAACADAPPPPADAPHTDAPPPVPLESRADSLAFRAIEAAGGLDAWHALPTLRFEFGIDRGGQQQIAARHYWDKASDRYRVEWPGEGDTTYVALFSVWPDSGRVFANGQPLEGAAAEAAFETALGRTINDTYWLAAPFKTFDEGVTRTYAPDSSDVQTEAVRLSFDGVGLTPGDQYWLFFDREAGHLARWTFLLEGQTDARSFDWTAYQTLEGPAGPVRLSARKQSRSAPVAILTDGLRAPSAADSSLFTDPRPRL